MTSVRRHCITTILIVCLLNVVYCQLIATGMQWGNQNGVSQAQFGLSQLPSASEDVDDKIALSALQFALNVGLQLSDSGNGASSEVFSPLSVMSALALLMLGAKGNSFEELRHLFQLNYDPNKFLEEFGHMLQDVQKSDINSQEKLRPQPNWRTTRARNNIRRAGSREKSTPYDYTLKVANGIFTQQNYQLNPDYRQVVTSLYKSDLTQLDFYNNPATAVFTINDWVNRSTFGKIPQIISQEISKYTNVIIGSALYFKGFWENSFYEMATDWDDFYADGPQSQPIKVRMMATGGEFPYYNAKEYGCRIIGLPYKGNLTTMYIIHPDNSTRQNLAALQRSLTADTIDYMISRMVQSSALVALPKLKFTRTHNMKNILGRLGVRDIFASGISDLSLIGKTPTYVASVPEVAKYIETEPEVARTTTPFMSKTQNRQNFKDRFDGPAKIWTRFGGVQEDKNKESLNSLQLQRTRQIHDRSELFVDDILHKVVFDVNEHGTEAAAATLAVLFRSGTDVLFRLDSPFIILIRHDLTKLPLFYGVINEPILE